jgi:cell pole-organizing protein PopZ
MALQDPQAEPSMEEILASIRRIISEEEQAPNAAPVLDLTQTDEPAPAPAPEPAAPEPEDDIVFEAVEQAVAEETPVPAQPAYAAPEPVRAPAEPAETILSTPTTTAAAGSLARLAGSLRVSDTPGQTVEGVVRELLKPMLKEWLDQNLAAIVEARGEAELERIARMSR